LVRGASQVTRPLTAFRTGLFRSIWLGAMSSASAIVDKSILDTLRLLVAGGFRHSEEKNSYTGRPLKERELAKILVVGDQDAPLLLRPLEHCIVPQLRISIRNGGHFMACESKCLEDRGFDVVIGKEPHEARRIRGNTSSVPIAHRA